MSGLNRNSVNRPKTLGCKNPTAKAVGEVKIQIGEKVAINNNFLKGFHVNENKSEQLYHKLKDQVGFVTEANSRSRKYLVSFPKVSKITNFILAESELDVVSNAEMFIRGL